MMTPAETIKGSRRNSIHQEGAARFDHLVLRLGRGSAELDPGLDNVSSPACGPGAVGRGAGKAWRSAHGRAAAVGRPRPRGLSQPAAEALRTAWPGSKQVAGDLGGRSRGGDPSSCGFAACPPPLDGSLVLAGARPRRAASADGASAAGSLGGALNKPGYGQTERAFTTPLCSAGREV